MTTDQQRETTITTPSDLEIRVERVFDAPRDLVYAVFHDPELGLVTTEKVGRARRCCFLHPGQRDSERLGELADRRAAPSSPTGGARPRAST